MAPAPLFWTVSGCDYGRSIAWAKRNPSPVTERLREALAAAQKGNLS
jgi:hypothetical protein